MLCCRSLEKQNLCPKEKTIKERLKKGLCWWDTQAFDFRTNALTWTSLLNDLALQLRFVRFFVTSADVSGQRGWNF
jgi:hypothetical protein